MEVGPRDGLQNIKTSIPSADKVELIKRLAGTGLRHIEATSFVSPKWVPQLADGMEVFMQVAPLRSQQPLRLQVLVPNLKGLHAAIEAGTEEITVFASATEACSKKNQNCTVNEALNTAQLVINTAREWNIAARGVISCIFSDPYSGPTEASQVLRVAQRMLEMGCYEVGLGDTLGVGTPTDTQELLDHLLKHIPADRLAGHFHDTYGQAVANVRRAYEMGLRSFDSSVAGLGGCPYAPGARGNVATEDVVYSLHQSGIDTGIDLEELSAVGDWISQRLGIPNNSRAGSAIQAKRVSKLASTPQVPSQPSSQSEHEWKDVQHLEGLKVQRKRNAVKITLTHPQNGNAMTSAMVDGMTKLFRDLAVDKSVFQIVLSAEGKFFCTGMDLTGDSRSDSQAYYAKITDMFTAIAEAPQVTIAAIDGLCYGGGVGLGFACDIRLVSEKVRWTMTEIKLGLSPAIISKYLAREWGLSFLREAMLTGRTVKPEELLRIGAVHRVVTDSGELDALVEDHIETLASCAPQSATVCKELVDVAWRDPGGLEQEALIQKTFSKMMEPGSEGEWGISQFKKKIKGNLDWAQFWNVKAKL
jgi:hydroxymethylglutaryl-CoA lyase